VQRVSHLPPHFHGKGDEILLARRDPYEFFHAPLLIMPFLACSAIGIILRAL
jgi:hypothetical protein